MWIYKLKGKSSTRQPKRVSKRFVCKKYYDTSYVDLRYIWNMSSEASRFTHNTLQILEKTNIGKSFLVLPCRKMCRCISNVEWFPSFSQFYEGKHHNGFHTCQWFRPSWCVWPAKIKKVKSTLSKELSQNSCFSWPENTIGLQMEGL